MIFENSVNLGLANSVIKGVTEVVNKYGRGIVLADDLLTAPGFLRYMNDALDRYENEEKVMQISGHMFDVDIEAETDAVFLPFTTSWGWATWKRAWSKFDPSAAGYDLLREDKSLRHKFDLDGTYDYFAMLERQLKGKVNSWAIRWYLSVFMLNGISLFPTKTLVYNFGFDGSGTHCGKIRHGEKTKDNDEDVSIGCVRIFPSVSVDRSFCVGVKSCLGSQNKFSFISKLSKILWK